MSVYDELNIFIEQIRKAFEVLGQEFEKLADVLGEIYDEEKTPKLKPQPIFHKKQEIKTDKITCNNYKFNPPVRRNLPYQRRHY